MSKQPDARSPDRRPLLQEAFRPRSTSLETVDYFLLWPNFGGAQTHTMLHPLPRILPKWSPPSPRPVSFGSRTPAWCRPPPALTWTQATTSARPPCPWPAGQTNLWPAISSTNPFMPRPCSAPTPGRPSPDHTPTPGTPTGSAPLLPPTPCAPLFQPHPPTAPGLIVHSKPHFSPPHRCPVPSPARPPGPSSSVPLPPGSLPRVPREPGCSEQWEGRRRFVPGWNTGTLSFRQAVGPWAGGWTSPSLTSHGPDQEARPT